jgi:ABC-2 type transport system permease protein
MMSRLASLVAVIPVVIVVLCLVMIFIDFNYIKSWNVGLWLLSTSIAIGIQYHISMILGLSSVWLGRSRNMTMLWFSLLQIFSGLMFPIEFLPEYIKSFLIYTPFPYLYYIPIKILMGEGDIPVLYQILCLLICSLCFAFVYKKAKLRLSCYGY